MCFNNDNISCKEKKNTIIVSLIAVSSLYIIQNYDGIKHLHVIKS